MENNLSLHPSLAHFSKLSTKRLAIKVKQKAERMVRRGHPWIFEDSIIKQSTNGSAGDLAIIYDQKKNKFLALGLYDPYSPIKIKLLQFKDPKKIDQGWFEAKINQAFQLRQPLLATQTNSYRLINGENDGLPSLITDVYAGVMVVKVYSPIWLPYLHQILPILIRVSNCQTIVLRLSRNLQQRKALLNELEDGMVIYGKLENEEVIFMEHGLKFIANVIQGHKTGFFLDHRHNRKRIGELSKKKTVLDIFAYAGGFSVHALAGVAEEVTSLDISAQALKTAQRNVALNFEDTSRHKILVGDAFELMEQLYLNNKKFDIVIVDPPSFAKKDTETERAIQAYTRLTRLAINLVAPNGILLMASCSSRVKKETFFEVVEKTLQASGRNFKLLEKKYHDVDHPISFEEGAYLKAGYYRGLD